MRLRTEYSIRSAEFQGFESLVRKVRTQVYSDSNEPPFIQPCRSNPSSTSPVHLAPTERRSYSFDQPLPMQAQKHAMHLVLGLLSLEISRSGLSGLHYLSHTVSD